MVGYYVASYVGSYGWYCVDTIVETMDCYTTSYLNLYRRSRIPFKITTNILASCANMPIDIFIQSLKNRLASKNNTTPTAITIF